MKLVTPSLVVNESDGFKNDVLQRKPFGEALSNLVERSTDELVISLDGKWGEGKTTFVKMWQGLLKEKGIPSVYIDAFQNDYTDDAFISIASTITSYVDLHSEEAGKKDFKEKAKKVGLRLLSWGAKVSIKAATLGVIKETDLDALGNIGEDAATDMSEAAAELINTRLSAHTEESQLIQSFRESLSEIPAQLKGNTSGRLVVIIDELDRCRPSFAVEILEKIKHLFSVENVVFMLVIHKEQLEEAIKCVYGQNIDAHTYLQKFINIETAVPKNITDRYNSDLKAYSKRLFKLHELETWGDERNILDSIEPLAKQFSLSLRQLEKVFTNLAVLYGTLGENHLRLVPVIVFISVIKVCKPRAYEKILLGKISYAELCTEIGIGVLDEDNPDERTLFFIMSWVRFSMLTNTEYSQIDSNDHIRRYGSSLCDYNIEREKLLLLFCQKLSMFNVN